MRKSGNILAILSTVGVIAGLAFISGCGQQENASVRMIRIPLSTNPDSEKAVYVDNFLNLTESDDLNLFEEGVAEMLEQSLSSVRTVKVIPRESVRKFMAMNDSSAEGTTTAEAARFNGAQYLVEGWIASQKDGTFRIYANLLNLESNEFQERIAIAEFGNRDDALPKLNDFVLDIAGKLSKSRGDLEQLSEYKIPHYEFYRTSMTAYQSYNRGKPEVSISLYEKALAMVDKLDMLNESDQIPDKEDTKAKLNFYLAQLYKEVGNENRAIKYLSRVYDTRERFPEMARTLVEALWQDLHGQFKAAESLYTQLMTKFPYEKDFYLLLADLYTRQGEDSVRSIDVLRQGLAHIPSDTKLSQRLAELRLTMGGEDILIADTAGEEGDDIPEPVNPEMVLSLVTARMEKDLVAVIPAVSLMSKEIQTAVDTSKQTQKVNLGEICIDMSKVETGIDYSCPTTTEYLVTLAEMAARSGKGDLVGVLAQAIEKYGTAPNSKDAYNTILATKYLMEGEFTEAKKYASRIDNKDPSRYITLGNILLHQGDREKAVAVMERALKLNTSLHPLVYYNIANAHLLAGHYKDWNKYSKLFIENSAKMNLIPATIKIDFKKEND